MKPFIVEYKQPDKIAEQFFDSISDALSFIR